MEKQASLGVNGARGLQLSIVERLLWGNNYLWKMNGAMERQVGSRKELLWINNLFLIENRAREWQVKRRKWLRQGDNSFLIKWLLWGKVSFIRKLGQCKVSKEHKKLLQGRKHFLIENGAEKGRSRIEMALIG